MAEKIEVSQAELDEKINEIAKSVRQPLDKVKDYYAKDEQLQALRNQILHEKTLDFVVSKAKIKTKKAKK
jgi:FKBP-type peptidyl-prolyl cis-trans isomerase (trigger factor)